MGYGTSFDVVVLKYHDLSCHSLFFLTISVLSNESDNLSKYLVKKFSDNYLILDGYVSETDIRHCDGLISLC